MSAVGFIGLGNMGGPMAANLSKAGHDVRGFDVSATAIEAAGKAGITSPLRPSPSPRGRRRHHHAAERPACP